MSEYEAKLILKSLEKFQKRVLSSKKEARRVLYEMGLITKSGKLSKRYGGTGK